MYCNNYAVDGQNQRREQVQEKVKRKNICNTPKISSLGGPRDEISFISLLKGERNMIRRRQITLEIKHIQMHGYRKRLMCTFRRMMYPT